MLGKRTRQALDGVWNQFASLASPTKSYVFDNVLDASLDSLDAPTAGQTTVLVAGATGRVGRILVRKLLLRGYRVRALVRRRDGVRDVAADDAVPDACEVVEGDVGSLAACQKAVRGVDKIIFCAAARSSFTGDLLRVEERGVRHLAGALQDEFARSARAQGQRHNPRAKREVADFSEKYHQLRWDVTAVGMQGEDGRITNSEFTRANLANAEISEGGNLVFEGTLFTRNALAEVGAALDAALPGGDARIAGTEGLAIRCKGEGHTYVAVVSTGPDQRYIARFPTRTGRYCTVRLPFAAFRPEREGQPPLVPAAITNIALRYELRRPSSSSIAAAAAAAGAPQPPSLPGAPRPAPGGAPGGALSRPPPRSAAAAAAAGTVAPSARMVASRAEAAALAQLQTFHLEVDWIKALPGGVEPDFILLSCSGAERAGLEQQELSKVVAAKRRGEEALRLSGLGYSIIRPGPLVDEPGGYKALVFDQSDRVGQVISCADVADICLRALHEPEARNKTFDVCYEFTPAQGLQMYELVASIPGGGKGSASYLAPALATLQRNT